MCGICGIFNVGTREPVAGSLLKDMADTLVHRGPDDEGFFFDGPVGLAHRRLSIIDVEGGHQPLCNEDQSIWVAFNGEIYNFQELREFLEKKGHVFKTRSDTEVIVHLYEEQGEACFRSLRGMFAVAIWDRPKQSVILARDRVGKKPLFYSFDGDQLAFGSEIKALLAIPRIKREIDLEALSDYFSLLYVPAPKSIFRSIRKVRAGHYVVVSPKGLRESEYWDIDFSQPEEQSEARWCDQIVQVLREAVQLRLISEVPLGAFLSGGIDSSSVVALMSQITGGGVVTASMGFREKAFDEISSQNLKASFQVETNNDVTQGTEVTFLNGQVGILEYDCSNIKNFIEGDYIEGTINLNHISSRSPTPLSSSGNLRLQIMG